LKRCKQTLLYVMLSMLFILSSTAQERQRTSKDGIHALLLLPKNTGANYFLIRDGLEEYGWQVTRAAVLDTVPPCGFWGERRGAVSILPDIKVSEIKDVTDYDFLIIIPSPGQAWKVPDSYSDFLSSPETLGLISIAAQKDVPVYAMCSGVRVLAAAGVLKGKKVVGSPRFQDEYEKAGAVYMGNDRNDSGPLIDGNIITAARGQFYDYSNSMAIMTLLENNIKTGQKKPADEKYVLSKDSNFIDKSIIWSKTYGGERIEMGNSVFPSEDGGCIIGANTGTFGGGNTNFYVIKTDRYGNQTWTGSFGARGEKGHGFDWCTSLYPADDGGSLITGYSDCNDLMDAVVIKTGSGGKEIWQKSFGNNPFYEFGNSIVEIKDGCSIVAGVTKSMVRVPEKYKNVYNNDIYLTKLDSKGNIIWQKTISGPESDSANACITAKNGDIMVLGHTKTSKNGLDVLLMRILDQ